MSIITPATAPGHRPVSENLLWGSYPVALRTPSIIHPPECDHRGSIGYRRSLVAFIYQLLYNQTLEFRRDKSIDLLD